MLISWVTSLCLSGLSAILRGKQKQTNELTEQEERAASFVTNACTQLCGFASWRAGSCLPARVLLTLWRLTGSAFSDLARVSLDSKQPLTTAFYTTKKMRLLWEETAALGCCQKGALTVCLAERHHTAQTCLKLASPINHLHNEVKCLPLPSDIFVSLFIFNDDMALSVSSWLFIFHVPKH